MRKTMLLLIVIVLLSSLVLAAPPTGPQAEDSQTGTLQIVSPKNEFMVMGTNITLHFHVFNSTGRLLYDGLNCSFHLYNNSGKHIMEENLSFDSNLIDMYVRIDGSLIPERGEYPYIVECLEESTGVGGFHAGTFRADSHGSSTDNEYLLPMIVALIGIAALFLYFMNSLDEEHILYKLIITVFFLGTLILIPSALINGQIATQDNIIKMTTWFMRVFFIYIIVYFIYSIWLKGVLIDIGIIKDKKVGKKP